MTLHFTARVERKAPSLPPFVVVHTSVVEKWELTETTTVEVVLDGVPIGRRSLKRWPQRDGWFFDLTAKHLEQASVSVGSDVGVEMLRASDELPDELRDLLENERDADSAWRRLSRARRRQIAEHVREAKRSETRIRRARKALLGKSRP